MGGLCTMGELFAEVAEGDVMTPDELLERIALEVEAENTRYREALDMIWSTLATYSEDEWPDVGTAEDLLFAAFTLAGYPPLGGGDSDSFKKETGRECPDVWRFDEDA